MSETTNPRLFVENHRPEVQTNRLGPTIKESSRLMKLPKVGRRDLPSRVLDGARYSKKSRLHPDVREKCPAERGFCRSVLRCHASINGLAAGRAGFETSSAPCLDMDSFLEQSCGRKDRVWDDPVAAIYSASLKWGFVL